MTIGVHIRLAHSGDLTAIQLLDHIAHDCERRRQFISETVEAETCYVAEASGQVLGYAVLSYHFYDNGFVDMLYVDADHRRLGAGAALLNHLESVCRTPKLFTSTNLSNLPMQALLIREGFRLCGTVHELDPGDPELFYLKQLDVHAG